VVSEVRSHIAKPLANARGLDRSRDREGAIFAEYESILMKRCANWLIFFRFCTLSRMSCFNPLCCVDKRQLSVYTLVAALEPLQEEQ
jgi:hypothetical protein